MTGGFGVIKRMPTKVRVLIDHDTPEIEKMIGQHPVASSNIENANF